MLIDLPGGWQLKTNELELGRGYYIWHKHDKDSEHQAWTCHVYRKDGYCHHCGADMPDEIGGFIQLLEWER